MPSYPNPKHPRPNNNRVITLSHIDLIAVATAAFRNGRFSTLTRPRRLFLTVLFTPIASDSIRSSSGTLPQQIGENDSVALHNLANRHCYFRIELRARVRERVKLPVFAAGIDIPGKRRHQVA